MHTSRILVNAFVAIFLKNAVYASALGLFSVDPKLILFSLLSIFWNFSLRHSIGDRVGRWNFNTNIACFLSVLQLLPQVFTPALRISKGRWVVPLSNDIVQIHPHQKSRVYSVRGAHSEAESSKLPGAFVEISDSKSK